MLSALIIDDAAKARIKRVITHAEKHPYTVEVVEHSLETGVPITQNDPKHYCDIALGYRCAFTIEPALHKETRNPLGYLRHLSVSINGGDLPGPPAMEILMQLFGFTCELMDCAKDGLVWFEDCSSEGDPRQAVNVVQFIQAEDGEATPR